MRLPIQIKECFMDGNFKNRCGGVNRGIHYRHSLDIPSPSSLLSANPIEAGVGMDF